MGAGASRFRYDADVRDEEAEEGSHRQYTSARARHEREDHHARLSQRLHRQVRGTARWPKTDCLNLKNHPACACTICGTEQKLISKSVNQEANCADCYSPKLVQIHF